MATEVQICNMALARLGVKALISSRTDGSQEAALCDAFFDVSRDKVLAALPWPFATVTEQLALLAETNLEWEYVYQLPSDCVKVRRLTLGLRQVPVAAKIPYAIVASSGLEAKVLCCDVPDVYVVYTKRITDPTNWDPAFVDAVAWELAIDLAMPMSVKADLQQAFRENARRALYEAGAQALREQQEDFPLDSEFILERQ